MLLKIVGGDNRFYNNIYVGVKGEADLSKNRQINPKSKPASGGISMYDQLAISSPADGNIFYCGAKPNKYATNSIVDDNYTPTIEINQLEDCVEVTLEFNSAIEDVKTQTVSSDLLGITKTTRANFEENEFIPYIFTKDIYGKTRNSKNPTVGPFENLLKGKTTYKFEFRK